MKYYPEGVNTALQKKFVTIDDVKSACQKKEIIEGKVYLCDQNHNLHINLGVIEGIIPHNEGAYGIIEGTLRDIALISKVNKYVCFRIVGFSRNENGKIVAILSRRSVQLDCINEFICLLHIGDIIEARVTHLEKFGAFIDIGAGINSLIPIDMLSVSRISHPSERLKEGQMIKTALLSRDNNKLTFTLKELLGTWQQNIQPFSVGETVTGVVRSIEPYGVFIELLPNLAGLAEPCEELFVGQQVSVFIKSIIPEKMKIKLVIVEAFKEKATTQDLVYFEKSNHINCFKYSPDNCEKSIATYFEYCE